MKQDVIVVGVDGSPASDRALEWAMREAAAECRCQEMEAKKEVVTVMVWYVSVMSSFGCLGISVLWFVGLDPKAWQTPRLAFASGQGSRR